VSSKGVSVEVVEVNRQKPLRGEDVKRSESLREPYGFAGEDDMRGASTREICRGRRERYAARSEVKRSVTQR